MAKNWFLSILVFALVVSCAQDRAGEEDRLAHEVAAPRSVAGKFIHTVLFWLKEGTSDDQKQQLLSDCRSLLGSISSVRYLAAGLPAGTPREVVDNSYDVGLVVHFEDQAGHDSYQEAQEHLAFIARNQETWERVQVYDILVE